MKIVQTIIASAIAATAVTMLLLPKAEASTVQTMQNHIDMATAALACATTVGYVHMPVAEKVLAAAEQYGKEHGFMISAMEKVQVALPAAIIEIATSQNGIGMCTRISKLITEKYGFKG